MPCSRHFNHKHLRKEKYGAKNYISNYIFIQEKRGSRDQIDDREYRFEIDDR